MKPTIGISKEEELRLAEEWKKEMEDKELLNIKLKKYLMK